MDKVELRNYLKTQFSTIMGPDSRLEEGNGPTKASHAYVVGSAGWFVGVEIVAVINSVIVAALVALISFPGSVVVSGLGALAGFVASAVVHGLAIRSSYSSSGKA